MNILLTNDDGIAAPGIWAAAGALSGLGRVTVVAPAHNHSGYGAALPPTRSLAYFTYSRGEEQPATVTAFGLYATPAACAQAGLSGVLGGGPFDLVVSGINHGANQGLDMFYSGTVGAALTAHLLGVPAIAVSLAAGAAGVAHWETAAWALGQVVELWQANPEPSPGFFNVNVPNRPVSSVNGTLIATPANDSCLTKYRFQPDPHAEHALAVIREDDGYVPEPWTDAWALQLGYVSVTPLKAIPGLLCVLPSSAAAEPVRLSVLVAGELAE